VAPLSNGPLDSRNEVFQKEPGFLWIPPWEGEGTIVLEVPGLFEILKKPKLGTLGLWASSVSSVTGEVPVLCVALRLASEEEESRLGFAVYVG